MSSMLSSTPLSLSPQSSSPQSPAPLSSAPQLSVPLSSAPPLSVPPLTACCRPRCRQSRRLRRRGRRLRRICAPSSPEEGQVHRRVCKMYAPTFCIPFMTCNPAMLVPTPGPGMYVISDYFFKKKIHSISTDSY